MSNQREDDGSSAAAAGVGFNSAIHSLIAKQTEEAVIRRSADGEDSERKKAILAHYAEVSDGEQYPWMNCLWLWC